MPKSIAVDPQAFQRAGELSFPRIPLHAYARPFGDELAALWTAQRRRRARLACDCVQLVTTVLAELTFTHDVGAAVLAAALDHLSPPFIDVCTARNAA